MADDDFLLNTLGGGQQKDLGLSRVVIKERIRYMRLALMDLATGLGATGVLPIEALLARRASRPGHRSWTVAEGEWIRKSSTSASRRLCRLAKCMVGLF